MQPTLFEPDISKIIPLREYQQKSLEEILDRLNGAKNIHELKVLCQQPTGAGKSLIMMALIAHWVKQNRKVLILVHKVELLYQTCQHLEKWVGCEYGIIGDRSVFRTRNLDAPVLIGSIGAFLKLRPRPLDIDCVVFDEAHHCHARTWAALFDFYSEAAIVGFSATPTRNDGRGLKRLFGGVLGFSHLVKGVKVKDLIDQGYLVPFRIFAGKRLADPSKLKIVAGDYDASQLEDLVTEEIELAEVVRHWEKHSLNKQTIVYPVSVEYSMNLRDKFEELGYPAAHIDASTPKKQRQQILNAFRDRRIKILCQHSIIIEGFDVPSIETIIFARPTRSLNIWFQAIGRALRPSPNKRECVILDHTTNHKCLPWPTDIIEWSLDPLVIKPTKYTHQCPACFHVYRLTQLETQTQESHCPVCNFNHSWTIIVKDNPNNPEEEEKTIQEKDELKEIQKKLTLWRLETRETILWSKYAHVNAESPLEEKLEFLLDYVGTLAKICAQKKHKPEWQLYRLSDALKPYQIPISAVSNRTFSSRLAAILYGNLHTSHISHFLNNNLNIR